MKRFLDVAYIVLRRENKPLSAVELIEKALEQGLLTTAGKTPHHSMRARLSTDILKNKGRSRFIRTNAGEFALREWDEREFHAPRFKKSLFDEEIVVFDKSYLKEFVNSNGLNRNTIGINKIIERMNQICYPMRRRIAEERQDIIQLISVFIVHFKNKYLTFKRTKRLPESRLHNFYSIAFGGHLSPNDFWPLFSSFNPLREFSEELKVKIEPDIKFIGLLYDDSQTVSKIHLGLVYKAFLKNKDYEIGERGFLMDHKFEDIISIENRIEDFENWSQIIIIEELKRHESKNNSRQLIK